MFVRYYARPDKVDRIWSSWISGAIEQEVRWLEQRHYSNRSLARRIPLVFSFGEFARSQGAATWADLPTHVDPFITAWLKQHVRGRKSAQQRKKIAECVRNPIEQMLSLIVPGFTGQGRAKRP